MSPTVWRAIALSLSLGGLFPLIYSGFNCLTVEYRTPMDPAAFYALPYEKQKDWLRENETRVTGLKCLGGRIGSWQFWAEYVDFAAFLVGLVFASCLLMARWERSRRHATGLELPAPADDSAP